MGHDKLKKKRVATAEAALARLTQNYSTAMKCVGALHRLSSTIDDLLRKKEEKEREQQSIQSPGNNKEQSDDVINNDDKHKTNELLSQLVRVAQAARLALQEHILLDPLVLMYAPSFYHAFNSIKLQQIQQQTNDNEQERNILGELTS